MDVDADDQHGGVVVVVFVSVFLRPLGLTHISSLANTRAARRVAASVHPHTPVRGSMGRRRRTDGESQ